MAKLYAANDLLRNAHTRPAGTTKDELPTKRPVKRTEICGRCCSFRRTR